MNKEKNPRERYSVRIHRDRFLSAVQELVPEVLANLARDVFPLFRALYREEPSKEPGERRIVVYWGEPGVREKNLWFTNHSQTNFNDPNWFGHFWASEFGGEALEPDRAAFRNAMEKWASAHHLTTEWIKKEAYHTLNSWLMNPHDDRNWATRFVAGWLCYTKDDKANAPTLHIDDRWCFEPWPVVNKRLQAQIAVYRTEVKKYSQLMGFDPEIVRKSRAHHQWLALYQCRGKSPTEIRAWHRKEHNSTVDATAVSHAIEALAKVIGLERRPPRRGPDRSG
ncbi:MAG: hypothetical protein ABSH47_19090 [Bryobacteraceae bacterium]|jgi:hypothetical protein